MLCLLYIYIYINFGGSSWLHITQGEVYELFLSHTYRVEFMWSMVSDLQKIFCLACCTIFCLNIYQITIYPSWTCHLILVISPILTYRVDYKNNWLNNNWQKNKNKNSWKTIVYFWRKKIILRDVLFNKPHNSKLHLTTERRGTESFWAVNCIENIILTRPASQSWIALELQATRSY